MEDVEGFFQEEQQIAMFLSFQQMLTPLVGKTFNDVVNILQFDGAGKI